jgi:diacylglycerol kinase
MQIWQNLICLIVVPIVVNILSHVLEKVVDERLDNSHHSQRNYHKHKNKRR